MLLFFSIYVGVHCLTCLGGEALLLWSPLLKALIVPVPIGGTLMYTSCLDCSRALLLAGLTSTSCLDCPSAHLTQLC